MRGHRGRPDRAWMCVYIWLIRIVVQQKLTAWCKAVILQFKNYPLCAPHGGK